MSDRQVVIRAADQPGDLGWIVMAHGEQYATEFGWDGGFEAVVARIVADYAESHDPGREAAWIAGTSRSRLGCVLVVAAGENVAQLRVLLVDPAVRGRGIGGRLVATAVGFARQAGYQRMRLWTNDILTSAIRIYLKAGFVLAGSEPHHSYGKHLVGQIYQLELSDGG